MAVVLCLASIGWSVPTHQDDAPSKRHFLFLDYEFIFTLELVQSGIPILNFINLGTKSYNLQASDVRIIAGIKLYKPRLFDVETADPNDPLRVSSIRIRPRSSFGITLIGDLAPVSEIDRVSIKLGQNHFDLRSISSKSFDTLSEKIMRINLLSPNIRDDFRVLELKSMGWRRRIPQ